MTVPALDPFVGAASAVAEVTRNIVCVGATPLAITDCLNMGNPERPLGAWQLERTIAGIAAACDALGVPVVSGNVSLYNETEGKAIFPTPTVGMVGLVEPVDRTCTSHFKRAGDLVVRTPTFDRLAHEGILFNSCFSAAPSCTPSRAAMLTGQYPHRLEEGSCLWGFLPKKFPVYPDLLEKSGYVVGCTRKGWGPGDFRAGGYSRNPAGTEFNSFAEFLKTVPQGKPFCCR